jgi:hypothetical protein
VKESSIIYKQFVTTIQKKKMNKIVMGVVFAAILFFGLMRNLAEGRNVNEAEFDRIISQIIEDGRQKVCLFEKNLEHRKC